MNMKYLDPGQYYEAELLAMGEDHSTPPGLTADSEHWPQGKQSYWTIWVVLRDKEGEHIDEILDMDIPVEFEELADQLFSAIQAKIELCNDRKLTLT